MVELKGLDAFSRTGPAWSARSIHELAIDKVSPDPENVRKRFDETALEELAASLKSRGLIQPITVTRPDKEGHATIRHGERRWRAAKIAGFEKIKVVIDESNDASSRSIDQYVENEQREGLSPSEVVAFVAARQAEGMKAGELAKEIGKSKAAISKFTSMIDAPPYVKDHLDQFGVETAYHLLQSHKIDALATEQFVSEHNGELTQREARAFQGSLKAPKIADERASDQEAGVAGNGGTKESAVRGRQNDGADAAGSGRAGNEDAPSPTPSSSSAKPKPSAERQRDTVVRPMIEVDGRRAEFISGMLRFEGEDEPRFVEFPA